MEPKEEIVEDIKIQDPVPVTGGKRKSKRRVNPALGKWVAFVKRVQKEEKLSYKDAMMRAKARKDKGEKWMGGGGSATQVQPGVQIARTTASPGATYRHRGGNALMLRGGEGDDEMEEVVFEEKEMDDEMEGGRRRRRRHRRRTHKRRGSKKRRHTRRR